MAFDRILFICTGNICRSPMAEVLLAAHLSAEAKVMSAGTHALIGHPADEQACALLAERGLDLSGHRARQVSPQLLRWADLTLVMQTRHLQELYALAPSARGKLFLIGHWLDEKEVADPYQKGQGAFKRTLGALDAALASWLPKIAPAMS